MTVMVIAIVRHPGGGKNSMHVYGCSVAYGICVEEDETLTAVLNQRDSTYQWLNYGVPSFSTVQNYIDFKKNIDRQRIPHAAFFLYGSFHDERNVLSPGWLKNFHRTEYDFFVPYASMSSDSTVRIAYKKLRYKWLSVLKCSALANAVDDALNARVSRNDHQLTIPLFQSIKQLADRHGTRIVACMMTQDEPTQRLINYCKGNEIPVIDFSEIMNRADCSCQPRDGHPNALAHQLFADSILALLEKSGVK